MTEAGSPSPGMPRAAGDRDLGAHCPVPCAAHKAPELPPGSALLPGCGRHSSALA